MVMKVGKINPVLFKGVEPVTKPENTKSQPQIKELRAVTPDFTVQTPQKYSFLGVQDIGNGLELHSYKLANGQRVSIVPMKDSPTTVKNYVNVGSMNETDDIKGISHFLEHMAFNGTNGSDGYLKLNQGDSFKKIEDLGGWTNASTNYAMTDYVNSTPLLDENDLKTQLQVIASMTDDLALSEEMIQKEKGPVSSEINMILDSPQTIALDETTRTLFNIRSSADELVGGSVNHIKNLTREDVKNYYDKYYTPDNMNLVITGNVDPQKTIELVSKYFKSNKMQQGQRYETKLNPIKSTVRKDFINDKAKSTTIVLGFAGAPVNDTKSRIIVDMLDEYILSSKTGLQKELDKINASTPGMGVDKISTNTKSPTMIYFVQNCSEEKSEKVLKILFDKLSNLKEPTEKDLNNIKEKFIQNHSNILEYSYAVNNTIGSAISNDNLDYLTDYENIVNSITTDDIKDFINKYLDMNKVALTVVHPQTTVEQLKENHNQASNISFKGKIQTLNNNYKLGTVDTKNKNAYFDINLYYDMPDCNPAIKSVLSNIYDQNLNSEEFLKFAEENNLSIDYDLSKERFSISGYSGEQNFKKTVNAVKELINNPKITQEQLDKAVDSISDRMKRLDDESARLYNDYESKTNPLYVSRDEILNGLSKVTLDDVKKLHQHIVNNSIGTIATNVESIDTFEDFAAVKKGDYKPKEVYKPNNKVTVLTKDKPASQADIMQVFKFEWENSPKEVAISNIMNTILSSSHSVGLFNTLREKERLAYSVYSDIYHIGNCGEITLNILTTTDNKEIGEISYDNLQKSINGFNRQIGELLNSKYEDADLESAKRILKAKLLQKEGVWAKLDELNTDLRNCEGFKNQMFNEIDNITREDIDNFAKKVFANPPTYAIVASKDTLEYNKEYLANLAAN